MLNPALLERALTWIHTERGDAHLASGRRAFEAETGSIEDGALDYEARISHFLEQYLCDDERGALAAFAAGAPDLDDDARRQLAGWRRSHRSLFAFVGFDSQGGALRDAVFGGLYRFWPQARDVQLVTGDRFDARLVAVGDTLYLSPSRVYHPREVHAALDALLPQIDLDSLAPRSLLNALLLMRSRFLSFASVRPEHVYQPRALTPVQLPLRAAASGPGRRGP